MAERTKFMCTKTLATLVDGFWEVIADMTSSEQVGDELPDTRTIAIRSIDKNLERAVRTANHALQARFVQLEYNLYNIPKEQDGKYFPYPIKDIQAT